MLRTQTHKRLVERRVQLLSKSLKRSLKMKRKQIPRPQKKKQLLRKFRRNWTKIRQKQTKRKRTKQRRRPRNRKIRLRNKRMSWQSQLTMLINRRNNLKRKLLQIRPRRKMTINLRTHHRKCQRESPTNLQRISTKKSSRRLLKIQ